MVQGERETKDVIDEWRVEILNKGSLILVVFSVAWGALFVFRPEFASVRNYLALCVISSLPPAIRPLGYRLRSTLLVAGFGFVAFMGSWSSGPAPGSVLAGLIGVVAAGLLFGVRHAVAMWIVSCLLFAAGLKLAGDGNGPFRLDFLDPADSSNYQRLVGAYVTISSFLAVGVSIVVNRLSSAVNEEKISASEALKANEERENALHHLVEAQKFEVMAELSGSVAHDVNNSLQVLMACAENLEEDADDPEKTRELANIMLDVCQDTSDLARQLLTLGKRIVLDQRVLDLGGELRNMQGALERILPANVTLQFDSPEGHIVFIDRLQLKQALLNLTLNAAHAMPDGGKISVSVCEAEGKMIDLTVRDDGVGMDEETLANIFNPFFSTKGAKGSGLGLPSVKAIVEQHGGHLRVQSKVGRGTSFHLLLPRSELNVEKVSSSQKLQACNLKGVLVLVVDDDQRVRHAIRQMLNDAGAQVLEAADGEAALAVVRSAEQGIDVLCTDAVMPGMRTQDMLEHFKKISPETSIVVCSAYVESELVRRGIQTRAYTHLAKPFSADALIRKISVAAERAI